MVAVTSGSGALLTKPHALRQIGHIRIRTAARNIFRILTAVISIVMRQISECGTARGRVCVLSSR